MHLSSMDVWDFILKFSGELGLLVAALLTGWLNFHFFYGSAQHNYQDSSYAARLLAYHSAYNPRLAEKNGSIITTVVQNGFIAQAQADDFTGLTQPTDPMPADQAANGVVINDDGMVKPNPDSVQGLVAKQIKIYQTQPGDTLKSVAAEFGISIQTIKWANNLPNDTIKPGWQLIILPTDGVLVKADSNTTLPDIAAKYKVPLDTIISYNLLDGPEDIDNGQLIIVPGGVMPEPPKPKPAPKPAKPKSSGSTGDEYTPPAQEDVGTGHLFPWGYCTWYVASRIHVPWGGNAKNWIANARAYGAVVNKEPAVGAIVVTNENRRFGHVAIVEQVEDGRFLVSEMNYAHFGRVDQRWISVGSSVIRGFIYH
ncbi:MAG: LysM peptidoglycan-binding domain-containing protein [Patescibacteria group bacterium]|nr:LysM peptidoglycan-binding domain-containing protein [Patescibacteria group bacterium]